MIKKILIILLIIIGLAIVGAGGILGYIIFVTPDVSTDEIYAGIEQKSEIYDKNGESIESINFAEGNRDIVHYGDIPQDLVDALVSTEDQSFWKHHGFNFVRTIGAIKQSITGGGQISGTSTISQQLARNVYLADIKSERSLSRKLKEAYYTIILEKSLSKKEIMEAYLNTIYFGYGSYGVATASEAYFDKSVSELSLGECVALAALPQAPDTYALVVADYGVDDVDKPILKKSDGVRYLYNGDVSEGRRDLIAKNMLELGMITQEEKTALDSLDLQDSIHVTPGETNAAANYFTDCVIQTLSEEFEDIYGMSSDEATRYVYTGGLKIFTTMDSDIQNILHEEINTDSNYTSIASYSTDANGNLLNKSGKVIAKSYDRLFSDGKYCIDSSLFEYEDDGSLLLKSGGNLSFYETTSSAGDDIAISFPDMYLWDDGALYLIQGGTINVPQGYKKKTDEGDCIISSEFLDDYPEFFGKSGDDIYIGSENYTLSAKTRQPQAAGAIIENGTGEVRAIVGGRDSSGKLDYNRAINTRQPGSSIKPIAVYAPALQKGYEAYAEGEEDMNLDTSKGDRWGKYFTAASIINDAPMYVDGELWPKNSNGGYSGLISMRTAIRNSVNVAAVKIYQQLGADYVIEKLQENGITSIDEEGDTNDINAAALALGGMCDGISPLELTAAYSTFPSKGIYTEPIFYTKVLDSRGDLIVEKEVETTQVYDSGVAWIMIDMMKGVVTNGTGVNAAISSQPVAGKTGTTSDQYDIWFAGFTPQYTMALWEGNDYNIELASSSSAAASFWSKIMERVCKGTKRQEFYAQPSGVVKYNGEYYLNGTMGFFMQTTTNNNNSDDTYYPQTTTESTTKQSDENSNKENTTRSTTSPGIDVPEYDDEVEDLVE